MSKWVLVVLGVALAAGFAAWLVLTQWQAVQPPVPELAEAGSPAPQAPVVPEAAVTAAETASVTEPAAVEAAAPAPVPAPAAPVTPARKARPSVDGVVSEGEYPHATDVAGVKVFWMNDDRVLCVGLVSPGTGYVAIGFDPVDRMLGANYILGSVDEGVLTIRDDYGNSATGHDADTTLGGLDNILSAAGHQWADQTVVEFVIPLDSGDTTDKRLAAGSSYPVLVAYNALSDDFSVRHSRRGVGRITLDPAP